MNVPVVMPQLGLTMTEGSVAEWLKKPGDSVRKGEMLFVVSTDKADMEVESLDEGTLQQIIVEPGKTVPVGSTIAYLTGPAGVVAVSPAPTAAIAEPAAAPAQPERVPIAGAANAAPLSTPARRRNGAPASPRARRAAQQLGIDISKVQPQGVSARVVEADVRRFAAAAQDKLSPSAAPDLRRRQVIADRLTTSIQTIPHFAVSVEVRADALVALRDSLKEPILRQAGLKLTVTDLLLKALGLALAETPEMQVVWAEGGPQACTAIDLGLAVASERGVAAPVIRNVAALELLALVRSRHDVANKARNGRLALNELEGGIGTLSNLGMQRVDQFQAIISPGQSFILATGRIAQRPWVENGALTVARTLTMTLSVDHRVADGALAGQFLERIAVIIENPYRILWTPHSGSI